MKHSIAAHWLLALSLGLASSACGDDADMPRTTAADGGSDAAAPKSKSNAARAADGGGSAPERATASDAGKPAA